MTDVQKAGAASQGAALPEDTPRAAFEPFEWLEVSSFPREHQLSARLVCSVRDVSSGVRTILEIIEANDLNKDDELEGRPVPPVLCRSAASSLLRLAVASLDMLDEKACNLQEKLSEAFPIKR